MPVSVFITLGEGIEEHVVMKTTRTVEESAPEAGNLSLSVRVTPDCYRLLFARYILT